jgi:O-antigen/teichoic acid export membrane protein
MWHKIKQLFDFQKGSTILGFTHFTGSAITGIFTIFAASLLGAENLGLISYFLAIAALGFTICSLGVANILLVYLSKGVKLFSTVSFLTLASSSIVAIIIFFVFDEIMLVVVIIGHVILELALHELLAKQLYSKYLKYFLTQKILFVTLSIPLFFLFGYVGFIFMYGLSMLPGIIRIYFGFKESKIDFTLIKDRSNFIVSNYLLYLARAAYVYVDRLIIFPLFGPVILGNYELAMQAIILGNVFAVFIYNYLLPKDARKQITYRIKLYAIIGSILIAFFIIFAGPPILPILFPEFHDAADLIPILGLSIIPHVFTILYMSKFLSSENTKIVLTSSIIHFLVLVFGIIILTHYYSTMGLVIAFVLGEIGEALFLMFMHKKFFKVYI